MNNIHAIRNSDLSLAGFLIMYMLSEIVGDLSLVGFLLGTIVSNVSE
jgi:hypothetical protein